MSDEQIGLYVQNLEWFNTIIIGAFKKGVLRGCVEIHLDREHPVRSAELAFSVETDFRSKKVGKSLLKEAIIVAQNRGLANVKINCASSNKRMIQLAKTLSPQKVQSEDFEIELEASLDKATLLTIWQEILADTFSVMLTPLMLRIPSRNLETLS